MFEIQNDVTHYPTKDPFGNPVHLRPIPDETQNAVAAYHSTEGSMLVTVLKYIQQMNIPTSFEKDNGAAIINWGRSFRQGGGTCAEHFGGFDQDPRFYLHNMFYNIDLPQLSKHDQVEQPSAYSVSTASRGHYSAYISANRDLVFSYEDETKPLKQKKRINIRFLPQDAEHAVKGLIYQAAHGLGRTSAKQLLDIIEYRYSPAFRAMQV